MLESLLDGIVAVSGADLGVFGTGNGGYGLEIEKRSSQDPEAPPVCVIHEHLQCPGRQIAFRKDAEAACHGMEFLPVLCGIA